MTDRDLMKQCAKYISADVETVELFACPVAATFKDSITGQTLR